MKTRNRNWIKRALDVQQIVKQHYLPGDQSRCKRWVFRCYVRPVYHISEATFFRYLAVNPAEAEEAAESKQGFIQLDLFNNQ